MAVREILKMGDPRLLRVAPPVTAFDTPELHALVADMFDTMAAAQGAGLAAPQIGVDLQLVIFGFERNERYPDAPPVPRTCWCNPVITPLDDERGRRLGRLPVGARPARRGAALAAHPLPRLRPAGRPIEREAEGFPCPRGAARMRPPDRPPVPDAHDRPDALGFTSVLFPDLDPTTERRPGLRKAILLRQRRSRIRRCADKTPLARGATEETPCPCPAPFPFSRPRCAGAPLPAWRWRWRP
jgi:peptide deformylase